MIGWLRGARGKQSAESAPATADALLEGFCAPKLTEGEIDARRAQIRLAFLGAGQGDVEKLKAADLERLFTLYDGAFFEGRLSRLAGEGRLKFRVSGRMTRVAGHLARFRGRTKGAPDTFEIAVSSQLLLSDFAQSGQAYMGGRCLADKTDALMRVFEHELTHLVETLMSGTTACGRRPFKALVRGLFGHTESTHRLPTPAARAAKEHGVVVGARVLFQYLGRAVAGRVNRIGKRATVLVEDARGTLYSDGRRYRKFYVELKALKKF